MPTRPALVFESMTWPSIRFFVVPSAASAADVTRDGTSRADVTSAIRASTLERRTRSPRRERDRIETVVRNVADVAGGPIGGRGAVATGHTDGVKLTGPGDVVAALDAQGYLADDGV